MQKSFTFLKSLTFVLTFGASLLTSAFAQQLPNASFEQWNRSWNNKPQPDAWNLANVEQVGMKFNIGERTSDAHSGSWAVKCRDTEVGALGITAVSPSWITLGTPWAYLDGLKVNSATAGTTGGIAWSYRPDTLAVWVKRSSALNEDVNLVYYSWHGTATNNSYKNKENGCTSTTREDEESDICKSDANECKTPSGDAVQVAQGWLRERRNYDNWTLVKVPIRYFNNDVPTKMNIILSASNYPNKRANSGLYTSSWLIVDDVEMVYSSKVYEMSFDGYAYTKFNKDILEYTYEVEGDKLPRITCKRSDRDLSGSEINIVYGQKDGAPTTVTVSAEDGSSTTTYTIHFVSKRDTNQYPATIKVNGTAISGFNAYVSNYSVELPYGIVDLPVIDVVKANDKQTVKIDPYTVPGVAKVTVYAESPDYYVTYNISFTTKKLSDTTLQSILVNGVKIEGYLPTKTIYKVNVPVGTTESPVISYVSAYPDGAQTVVIDRKGLDDVSTVTVSAPGATTSKVYKISYVITESTYSMLKDLKVDGTTISGFVPATLNYTYPLPLGTTSMPEVTYVAGDDYQTIVKEDGGIDGTTKITVTAQNGINTSIYRIQFPLSKSSNSKLLDIKVSGVSIEGFSSDVVGYNYTLPVGTETLPEISWVQGDEYQTVRPTYGGVNGITKLVVTAQDGSVTVYSIKFSVVQASNSTLKDIQLDGVSLADFAPEKTSYSIVLPRGTKVLPVITYTPYDEYQKITKIEGGVNGVTRITVKAQSGDVTTYTLSFSVEKSENSYLNDIKVGGVSLEDFESTRFEYDYQLESGTTELPTITWTQGDEYQKFTLVKGGVNGVTTIKVVAESGAESLYKITFSVKKSANANLKNIFIDNVSLEGFNPEIYSYIYALPEEAVQAPTITVEKEASQTVSITKPMLFGVAYINVTPEDGSGNVYTIKFVGSKGSNCNLSDLRVDGETVEGFAPEKTEYSVVLPAGTKVQPTISWTKEEDSQRVELQEGGINGVSTVTVLSENGSTKVYSINFSTQKSSDGLLSDIKVGGISIEGFASDVYEYTYVMPKTESVRPTIEGVKLSSLSRMHAVLPYSDGDAKFYITSEDGTQNSVYTVHFVYAKNAEAELDDIMVDGVSVGLQPDKFEYDVEFTQGFLPSVTYNKGDDSQIVLINNTETGVSLLVMAEDGTTAIYKVNFIKKHSSVSALADLQLYDQAQQRYISVADFASDKYDYVVTLPKGGKIPSINCVGADKNQTYVITYASAGQKTTIDVYAEDGEAVTTYSIQFDVEKSEVCTLDEISIDGVPLAEFSTDVYEYDVILSSSVGKRGAIGYTKSDNTSLVTLEDNEYTSTSIITVTSETGAQLTYKLNFKTDFEGKENTLSSIKVDGNVIEGFSPTKYDYTVSVVEGSDYPAVSYLKGYLAQTVYASVSEANGVQLIVRSNQTDVADAVYTINFEKILPYNNLSGISVNGVAISGFSADKKKYVVVVNDVPTSVSATSEYGSVSKTVDTPSHVRFETSEEAAYKSVIYDVYFHYANDVIPNSDFKNWEKTKYQVGGTYYKPSGWTVASDVTNTMVLGTAHCGDEIKQNKDGSVNFTTVYWGALASGIPSTMTLGNMSVSLKVAGATSVSFSGKGIKFKNTPDKAVIDYMQKAKKGNGFTIDYIFNDGTSKSFKFNNNKSSSSYVSDTLDLDTDGLNVAYLNIIANATGQTSKVGLNANVFLKSLGFIYSSKIASIKVNGVDVTLEGTSGTVELEDDFIGNPKVEIVGEVEDQMYDIIYGDEVNGKRTISIRSYAEDLSYTDYTVNVSRELIPATLSTIKVNGAEISNFQPDTYEYTYPLAAGTWYLPSVEAIVSSVRQSVDMSVNGNVVTIKAESTDASEAATYKVTFVEADLSKATLANLEVSGYDISFAPDITEYEVLLEVGTTAIPEILFNKISDKQSVVYTEGDVNGVTTLKVTSADKSVESTYTLKFSVAADDKTTSKLSMMGVLEDEGQIVFDADVFEYQYTKLVNDVAIIAYSRAFDVDSMVVTIDSDSAVWNIYNNVSGTANKYKLAINNEYSNNSQLADIKVCGVSIEDFNPNLTEYNVNIDRKSVPTVDVVLAEAGQTLESTYDAEAMSYTFVVVAADGVSSTTYSVSLVRVLGNKASLSDIKLDDASIENFDSDTFIYDVTLQEGATVIPEITAFAEAEGESMSLSVESNFVNAETMADGYISSQVDVESEDKLSNQIYYVNFKQTLSDDATLSSISANLVKLDGFDPNVMEYSVNVPLGSELPIITYQKANLSQVVEMESDADKTVINVTSESGLFTNIYKILFVKEQSSGSDLADIALDGVSMEDFAPNKYEYSIELPSDATVLPLIETVSGDYGQVVSITTNGVRGDAIINVVSQDGENSSVYTIHFSVAKSPYSYLAMIRLDGADMENFQPETLNYNVTLELGRTTIPEVTWELGHPGETVVKSEDENTVVLAVTSELGNVSEYTVDFAFNLSKADSLKMIYINDEEVPAFKPSVTEYNVTLPLGSDVSSVIVDYQIFDEWQTVKTDFFEGGVKLYVTAQDPVYTRTYTINIEVEKSTNTALLDLMSDGVTVDDFNPDVLNYEITLPMHTEIIPEVTYTAGDEYQTITKLVAENKKNVTITVTAQNGDSRVYTVAYYITPSDNTHLKSITLGDERQLIPSFDEGVYDYKVILPYGTKNVPVIDYEKSEDVQIVETNYTTDVNGTSTITVYAENGDSQVYTIKFSVAESDVTTLDMIYYNGNAVDGFVPSVNDYTVDLPYGTKEAPVVTYDFTEPENETATLSVVPIGNEGWLAEIEVTAKNRDVYNYSITFTIKKDSENRLTDIRTFGKTIEGFDMNVDNYEYILPPYSDPSLVPTKDDVEYITVNENEKVVVKQPSDESIIIEVTAQDGSIRNYVIKTTISLSSNTKLDGIYYNDLLLPGFDPDVLEYSYKLPFGSNSVDTEDVTYVAQEEGQKVMVSKNGLDVEVQVTSQDDENHAKYIIHFVPDEFDPNQQPTKDQVCVVSTPDGGWKFTTRCNNVTVMLTDLLGKILAVVELPVVDPNCTNLADPSADGFTYYVPRNNLVAFNFVYAKKTKVLTGKVKGL